MLPGSTKIADVQWVPSTIAPVIEVTEYGRTYIKGFLLHNTTSSAVNIKIHVVPAADDLLGQPSILNQALDTDIPARDTLCFDLSYPVTLQAIGDSVQAVASVAEAVSITPLGITVPRDLVSASITSAAFEFSSMPPTAIGDRVALVAPSASVVSALAPNSWDPSKIATQIWLDAADPATTITVSGALSEWLDKSGNARHVTQATASQRPLLVPNAVNNLNALDFDASDDRLLTPLNISTTRDWMIAAVFRPKDNFGRRVVASSNLNSLMSGARTSNCVYVNSADVRSAAWLPVQQLGIGVVLSPSVSGNLQFWGDGTNLTTTSSTARAWGILGLGAVQYGETANAIFCELIVTSATDSVTRQLIEGYLAHKWGTTGSLPAGHPYKVSAPSG
jgi:hypothetical protein